MGYGDRVPKAARPTPQDAVRIRLNIDGSDGSPMLRMRDARAGTDNRAPAEDDGRAVRAAREPQNHRTVDRVTQILEEVVYKPGMTFAELARALSAPKSSVYGFIQGLVAKGWWPRVGSTRRIIASISDPRSTA